MSTCAFDTGFDSGFQICVEEEAQPDTRYLRGVPVPRIRKRPEMADASGFGYVPVIGAGSLSGEAALASTFLQDVDLFGHLVRETFRVLVGQIRSGAEALLAGEYNAQASSTVAYGAQAWPTADATVAGSLAQRIDVWSQMAADSFVQGRMSIAVGGEAAIVGQESDEVVILAAGMLLARYLTD